MARWLIDQFDPRFYSNGKLFKSAKTVAAPDPAATAAAQSATNKETAYWNAMMNNVNQITPYGNLTWTNNSVDGTYDPNKPPQFTSTVTLSPESQQLLDTQMRSENALASLGEGQLGRITDAVSTPYSYSGISSAPTNEDINALSQRGQDAIMSRLNPQFAQDEEAMRTRLINQGIGQGSEAYNREMNTFNQAKNDARNQAILQGQAYGNAEQTQQLALRNQGIQEYNAIRNAPLNEYSAMTSGQQVQNPSFQNTSYSGAAAPDYAGLVNNQYQAQLANANAKTSSGNALMGGLFSLGGAAMTGGTGGFATSALGSLFK